MKNVLVIEDEEGTLRLYQAFLRIGKGLKFIGAGSAEEALDLLKVQKTEKVDAIIADMQLPGMDGLEFFHQLKAEGLLVNPFVFVTGHPSPKFTALLDQGVDRVFSKPILYREVINFINEKLKQAEEKAS